MGQRTGTGGRILRLFRGLVMGLLFSAQAAVACEVPDLKTDQRPGESDGATDVSVAVQVFDFLGVDDVNQQLEIDFFLNLGWQDPRLSGLDGCRFKITDVWIPQIRLLNSSRLVKAFQNARDEVAVSAGGQVQYVQRFTGRVSSYHNLSKYPFDRHQFEIAFGSERDQDTELRFVPDAARTWISERLNIEGWRIGAVWLDTGTQELPHANKVINVATLNIEAERHIEFFLYRFLLLLMFVVGMSWVIFWVPPSRMEFQIGLGATSMLTAIAFNISIANQLPPLGYLTILDKMVIWATMLIFCSIVEALLTGRLSMKGNDGLADRIDVICRFLFPVLLVAGWYFLLQS